MAETIKKVQYFYATIEDKPGTAKELLNNLSDRKVNLIAVTAFPQGDGLSQVDFFPEHPEHLIKAALDAGITLVGPKYAFLIQGDDKVGALHEHHMKLSDAGINIHAANGVVDGSGRFGYVLWVKPEDYEKASKAFGI
jgi:hypothetical protein